METVIMNIQPQSIIHQSFQLNLGPAGLASALRKSGPPSPATSYHPSDNIIDTSYHPNPINHARYSPASDKAEIHGQMWSRGLADLCGVKVTSQDRRPYSTSATYALVLLLTGPRGDEGGNISREQGRSKINT